MDFSTAAYDLLKTFGTIAVVGLGSLLGWRQISKVRSLNAGDDDERLRLTDAFASAQTARERAHELSNEMMAMQRRMGRLEAENEACNKRTDHLDAEVADLKAENRQQAGQIAELMRKKTINPNASDFGG